MNHPRLAPLPQPWPDAVAALLATYPQGPEGPIALFRTLAHSERTLRKLAGSGVLDRGSPLSIREREILILRVSYNAGCRYEWGIHVQTFARKAGLGPEQVRDTAAAVPDPRLWSSQEVCLLDLADQLHRNSDIDDALWSELNRHWITGQILEMLLLCGFYRTIGYFNNVLRVEQEPGTPAF